MSTSATIETRDEMTIGADGIERHRRDNGHCLSLRAHEMPMEVASVVWSSTRSSIDDERRGVAGGRGAGRRAGPVGIKLNSAYRLEGRTWS